MKCACGGSTIVKDGRLIEEGYWRRRCCDACGAESTTLEQLCETVKGTRIKQPKVVAVKPPKVAKPRAVRPPKPPKAVKPKWVLEAMEEIKKPARHRIEDMKLEKEYGLE